MTTMVPVPICGREDWTILMPEERAQRVQWPWHEWNRFHSMFHNLRPGDVLFDIGAEQGDQSALYQRWIQRPAWRDVIADAWTGEEISSGREVREGGIVLVEPNPKAWPNIKAVWDANELRTPLGFVGDFIADVHSVEFAPMDGWPEWADQPLAEYVGTAILHDQTVTTLDYLAVEFGVPDAITIDIEGGELDALAGAMSLLNGPRPLLWISVHWEMLLERGQSRKALLDFLAAFGYRYEHLGADHEEHIVAWHPEGRRPVLPYDGVMGS